MRVAVAAILLFLTFQTAPSSAKASPEYVDAVIQRLMSSAQAYPIRGDRNCRVLTTIVKFKIDRDGALSYAKVLKSSGFDIADKAAIINVQRAQPFPPPPRNFDDSFRVPIVFRPSRMRCPMLEM